MTRRCSVMRMPVAAQRASMPVFLSAEGDFSAVLISKSWRPPVGAEQGCSATARILRQVAPHQKRIQLFAAGLLVIALAAPDDAKSGPFIQPSRRLAIFLDLEEDPAHAAAGEMAEMRQQQMARQATAALARID